MACSLTGKRILVVEDEYYIAFDLKRALAARGAVVVGPTGDLARGMALIDHEPLDAAVLDINLEGATTYPIANGLIDRDVPFLFLTGYDDWALPSAYRHLPRIAKPCAMTAITAGLARLVEGAAS